jgi:hypothetical protein
LRYPPRLGPHARDQQGDLFGVDLVAREAWRREASHHEGHRNFRPHLRPRGANLMGLRGEEAFALAFDRPLDLSARPGGDGGRDLSIAITAGATNRLDGRLYAVDCKTALHPKDLIVEASRCQPETLYVLCRYLEESDRAELLGWQWGGVLLRSEPKDYGYGVLNHWCPAGELRSIAELHRQYWAGFVGYDSHRRFRHYCACGAWGAFGYDCKNDKPGTWYCAEHRP